MTPAALLVCVALVTNVDHGSVVTRDCHYEVQTVSTFSKNILPSEVPAASQEVVLNTYPMPDLPVKSLTIAVADSKPAKLHHKKKWSRQAKAHYRPITKSARPVMTAEQNRAFRYSWYERLAAQ